MTWTAVLCLVLVAWTEAQKVVDTEYGQVKGHTVNVNNGREQTAVDVFYAIPFAQPPVGALRFASPQKANGWTEIFEADSLGTACPQGTEFLQASIPDWDNIGEDCLHLNVFTPTEGTGPFAVMVWMYGGAYQIGANMQYPGHFIASRGVIVVVVNYRVNNFGFAYTGNDACPGNAGMLDQTMALQFVVDNIANFGGDPGRITVFGESAGGTSTSLHVISPLSNDLFQQAIIQSGSEMNFWGVNSPASHPEDYTRQIAEDLDCIRPDDYQMMDCLRSLTWQNIMENSTLRCAPGFICLGMAPVVDGPGGFLPQEPHELRASGDVLSGPIMSGICREDGSIFATLFAPLIGSDDCCNRTYFSHVLENRLVDWFDARLDNGTSDDVYHALDYMYTPWPYLHDTNNNRDKIVELVTDASFGVHWDRQLKDHCTVEPTYGFLYDYMSSTSDADEWLGTHHGADVPTVWGYALLDFNEEVQDDCGMLPLENNTQLDYDYAIFVQDLWTNFAKFGNPTPSPVSNPLGGVTTWSEFTMNDMNVLYLGAEGISNVKEYRQKEYSFWNQYLIGIAGEELGLGDDWPLYGTSSEELLRVIQDALQRV